MILSLIVASLTAAVTAQGGQTWHVAVVLRRSIGRLHSHS